MEIIDGTDEDDDGDGDENGDTFDPVDLGDGTTTVRSIGASDSVFTTAKRLVETESERDDSGDEQENLYISTDTIQSVHDSPRPYP